MGATNSQEQNTKPRTGDALMPLSAAGALEALGALGGPGGSATNALMSIGALVLSAPGMHPVAKLVFVGIVITAAFISWWNGKKKVPQNRLIEGLPNEGCIAYKQLVERCSRKPYTFKYTHPTDIITGIACVPVDEEIQSPEAEVIDGGVNYKHATICLTPVQDGRWACDVAICTKGSSATPSKEA